MARAKAKTSPRPDRIAPTPERMAKGDVVERRARDARGGQEGPVQYHIDGKRRNPDPVAVLFQSGKIDEDLVRTAHSFRALYHEAHSEPGCIDLLSSGGGGGSAAFNTTAARRMFRAMCRCVADTPEERQARWDVLIPVVALETPIRVVAFTHRRYEVAVQRIIASLCRVRAFLEAPEQPLDSADKMWQALRQF